MGVTTLQVNLNTEMMIDFGQIKQKRGYSSIKGDTHYMSDDAFAGMLLKETIAEQKKKGK